MSMDIEGMLGEFNLSAECSRELLQKMLDVISEGKVPKATEVKKLDSSINNLCQKYNEICSIALSQVTTEEMPENGSPAAEYVEAVRNSVSLQHKKRLEHIKKTLKDFLAVQSLVSNYAIALQPCQQQAEDLMTKIQENAIQEVEHLEFQIAGPKVFLESLACEDLDSDAGMELLDRVSEYYSRRVQNGLAAGKYFLPDSNDAETTFESDADSVVPETALGQKKNLVVEKKSLDAIISADSYNEPEDEQKVSEFVQKIIESGVLLDTKDNVGVLSVDKNTNEEKKITSSVFRNDIRKGGENVLRAILKVISEKNNVTIRFLTTIKGMPENLAVSALDYLQKKGYLRKYSLVFGGEFYCASPRLIKALTFKEAAKMIGVHQRTVDDWGESIEDKNTSVASRIVYGKLYCESVQRFIDAGKSSFTENGNTFSDAFFSRIFPSDKSTGCDIYIGAFWDNTDECDLFLERMQSVLEKKLPVGCIVFASLNIEKAKCLAAVMLDVLGGLLATEQIYLYSFWDDCYYTYPDGSEVEVLKISLENTEQENNELMDADTLAEPKGNFQEGTSGVVKQADEVGDNISGDIVSNESIEQNPIIPEKKRLVVKPVLSVTDINNSIKKVIDLINADKFYAAAAYSRVLASQHPEFDLFYKQLAHALNDPMEHCNYSTDNVFTLIDERGGFEDALVISTAIRMYFSNQVRYDYNLKSYYSGIKEYTLLNNYPALSKVIYILMEFKDSQQKGMDAYADYRSRSKAELDLKMRKLQQEARIFYENFVIGQKKEKAKQRRFLETKKLILSAESDMGQYIKAIVDDDADFQPMALEFLQEKFYKEETTIEEDTIDADKLWDYITGYWDMAGASMTYRRHADLMSHLRNNIISITTKAVQLIARWCDLVSRISNREEDEGDVAYKKIRKPLINNLESAIADITDAYENEATSDEEEAGLRVVVYTMKEILACLNGSYKEETRKYFYVPFLLTDDVMLDEDYMPDFDMHSSTMLSLQLTTRIFEHVRKVLEEAPTYTKRLTAILDEKGDDYGSARLIVDYLMQKESTEELEEISSNINSGEIYARETAGLRKDDFIGNLELAQSYGQIDNSVEDKKEKILQIVSEWNEWANDTSNYGFFKRVMDSYLAEIREEAKAREKDLLEQLESFKVTTIQGLSVEAREKRIARIKAMIREQNYTVAEDLLARSDTAEEEHEEIIEEDFLKEFLDNYDDYYHPVAMRKTPFANLVSSRTRNKEERGAKRLADNWLPGGSSLGKDRLANLLTCFGFKGASVEPHNAIGKFEHFFVRIAKAKGGQRDNYTHPIAAFGSGAALDGFRVVCINGTYDADGLIDVMKQIGNAKHTLLLLDYALSKSERRRLARKSKNALGDKLFAVIDRTVMMFLVRNYNENKINRMLISLVTPFGYYQPYVWESANVMPPEIFMGRKDELEKIKSPTGVNIVYGGRQLGKSALLKKAKGDINWDENGNRAVLVDVKGLDYKKAAKKIGHALHDEDILEQDITTEDWDELARAVKRRLQSDRNRIPYLLLLLDEADAFIDSCGGEVNYRPFDALKEIQSIGAGRFKFVIAGLRNIVRFKREALGKNSVLPHLEYMTVKPFNISEARELLEIPLHYLGLRFPKEKESLITLILATANYFPGLIQMYCAKLINAMRNKDYANYDEVNTPIYEVSENHIKKVLADPEFTQQIREKYIITLKLDEDNYYYLIALLMAFLYHNNGYNEGYSAAEIKHAGVELEIAKIAELEIVKLESFMEELKELNILRSTDETHYLFARFTFFQMMGTRVEVDDKLEEYMGE